MNERGIIMEENREHKLSIENREKLTISAVEDVESFDDEKVVVITDMGTLTVSGGNFRISRLNVDDGQLVIEGDIDGLEYSDTMDDGRGGFFGRLFK